MEKIYKKIQGAAVAGFMAAALLASCNTQPATQTSHESAVNTDTVNLKFTVEEAPEWTALFNRQHGWFGADGIFAIPLNGSDSTSSDTDSTMFLFSDTMLGDIVNGKLKPGFKMIHNSVAYMKGVSADTGSIRFVWDSTGDRKSESVFIPNTAKTQQGDYYWMGDGFVNQELNNNIYVFGHRVRNISTAAFGFKEVGNTIIVIPHSSRAPFKELRQLDMPAVYEGDDDNQYASFGVSVFVNTREAKAPNPDGYIYIYGLRGKEKNLLVARVKPASFENFNEWRYWDGNNWNADIKKVANTTSRASNELSVTPLRDGRYALVFQTDGIGSTVGLRLGTSPIGPWGPVIKLWDCPEVKMSKNIITYNAKAHPNLSKPGELLISYNVNSFDFFKDIMLYPDLYRPRFIRVKLQ